MVPLDFSEDGSEGNYLLTPLGSLGFETVSESLLLHSPSCRESQVPMKRGQNHSKPSAWVGVSGCERAVAAFGSSIVSMTVAQRTRCPAPHSTPAVRA